MGIWRDFFLGQPLEKKDDKNYEACGAKLVEEKPKSIWEDGSFSRKELLKHAGKEDLSGCTFVSGSYSSHKEELRRMFKEVTACKGNDWDKFSKKDIKDMIEKLRKIEPKNISVLLIKAFEDVLNQ
ncbi:MAG: hypothetical protein WC319_00530 [Candidatus Paceibacterota bacterium]|jgi:hypothetical protein